MVNYSILKNSNDLSERTAKKVRFDGAQTFFFKRQPGGCIVQRDGGPALGMAAQHFHVQWEDMKNAPEREKAKPFRPLERNKRRRKLLKEKVSTLQKLLRQSKQDERPRCNILHAALDAVCRSCINLCKPRTYVSAMRHIPVQLNAWKSWFARLFTLIIRFFTNRI